MAHPTLFAFLLLNLVLVYSSPLLKDDKKPACQNCHDLADGKINVHLVPHSHDDVGWLKTLKEYYYGTGDFTQIQDAGVQYILNSTIAALQKNPNRRFIQVETAFFWKWWQHQDNATKTAVKNLVNSGQLEIIGGGWSMNDEATTNYQSIIDQFTWGFRILDKYLGQCGQPNIGWQIDPFGHSRENAYLMKQLGFEGLVVGRLDHLDKAKRIKEQNLDFIWKTNDNFADSNIFTTMFPNFYVYETGFCFDSTCDLKTAINDNKTDPEYNLEDKVKEFSRILDIYSTFYQTPNILIPMGGDFNYQQAEINFENTEKLINGFKDNAVYNVFYSTPSCYIKAVTDGIQAKAKSLEQKVDDFFPYSSDALSFWAGYFTSRPTLKRFERIGNNILQSTKQLATFSRIAGKEYDKNLIALREAMGVMQHHDAITGTEKQKVAEDYIRILHKAIEKAEKPTGAIIENLLQINSTNDKDLKLSSCLLANVSICTISQKDKFLVVVQNPLSREVTNFVRLPVDGTSYKITGPDGEEHYDIFDTFDFGFVKEPIKPSTKELVFPAKNIPPLGIKLYYIEKLATDSGNYHPFEKLTDEDNGTFGTATNGFAVDTKTGKLASVTINERKTDLTQDFFYYLGANDGTKSSGAYIFRPADSTPKAITEETITFKAARGTIVDEFLQIFNREVQQIIRVYKSNIESYIEFDWLVGDLQFDYHNGKEVITKFTVKNFSNANLFYTDSNGRQQITRERNFPGNYDFNLADAPIAGNYYPVTSKIVIKDQSRDLEVAVLNDRAQGGTSLEDGTVELMVHRRLPRDDAFGVNEPLNETQYGKGLYVRGQHFLTLGTFNDVTGPSAASIERDLAQRKRLSPLILLSDASSSLDDIKKWLKFKFAGLKSSLPKNVLILTLEPWQDSYLLRLEHVFEKDEDTTWSGAAQVDLKNLFTLFEITEFAETQLGGNQVKRNGESAEWKNLTVENSKIKLHPMEIKTFLFKTDKINDGGQDDSDGDDDDNDDDDDDDDDDDNGDNGSQTISASIVLFVTASYVLFL